MTTHSADHLVLPVVTNVLALATIAAIGSGNRLRIMWLLLLLLKTLGECFEKVKNGTHYKIMSEMLPNFQKQISRKFYSTLVS